MMIADIVLESACLSDKIKQPDTVSMILSWNNEKLTA